MAACDMLEEVLFINGNGIVGVDVLEKDGETHFVVCFKADVLNKLSLLGDYAKSHGHTFACYLNGRADEMYVPKPTSIVLETVET